MNRVGRAAVATFISVLLVGCGREQPAPEQDHGSEADLAIADELLDGTDAPVQLVVAQTGNEVRYRVREQLVRRDLPNDAVGRTTAVSGALQLDEDGEIVPSGSRIVVDVTGLTSDSDRRDGYVRRRLLVTDSFPRVEFVPSQARGLPQRLPASGEMSFVLVGDLTVKGVTRPVEWEVDARAEGGDYTGSARTAFTFGDFELQQPRVPVLLSVADTIRLEYDFTLVPARTPRS